MLGPRGAGAELNTWRTTAHLAIKEASSTCLAIPLRAIPCKAMP